MRGDCRLCVGLDMPGNLNQKEEKKYFEKFRQDYPLPEGKVIYGDKPDVVINGLTKTGIEITSFYHKDGSSNESEQVQRVLREKTILDVQNLYLNDSGKNIAITFGFDEKIPIQAKGKKNLEKKLVELAKCIERWGEGSIPKETFKVIPELSFVNLTPREHQDARRRVCQVYRGKEMSRDRLLEIVQGKEGKVAHYEKCDVYWLVIVVDFFDPAQDQEIQIKDFDKIKFEIILVYKTAFGHIFQAK